MIKQFKHLIANISIAKQKKKKILNICYNKHLLQNINLLWDYNFIYGYYLIKAKKKI